MSAKTKKDSLLVVAGTGFLRAYSGTLYLVQGLEREGWDCKVLVGANEADESDYREVGVTIVSLPLAGRFAGLLRRAKVFWKLLCSRRVVLTENTYLLEAAFAKAILRDQLKLVHFCQELQLKKDYPNLPRISLLNRVATFPDLVIDVEPNRARSRRKYLGLNHDPWVLPNTIPVDILPERAPKGGLCQLAECEISNDLPIVIHMGGIGAEKPLERLIMMSKLCSQSHFFLAFCNGTPKQVNDLSREAGEHLPANRFKICGPRKRADLLASAWEADVGVIDYSPSVEDTDNQRFCAPTKLYEFMASGLAVLGSDNLSLENIIEIEAFGQCAKEGSADSLALALGNILSDHQALLGMKERARQSFGSTHCYEKCGEPVVKKLSAFLKNQLQ
ncbi:hypothetical protein OAF99_02685 [Akkermansiaceae bacterium]|nr:hypothetical protein [Akkermansiaceae bacterium]MDB4735070.1 hypothetical protein [Akkermansiaceae bacterium]MDB4759227.1 hypothetical protein [Akkermansiaceae bacterium]